MSKPDKTRSTQDIARDDDFKVTAPRGTLEWFDEVETAGQIRAIQELAEERIDRAAKRRRACFAFLNRKI